MKKELVLRGLDSFAPSEMDDIWEAKSKGKPRLLVIGLSTTDGCNYKCVYCYGPDFKDQGGSKLTLAEQCDLLDQAAALGAKTVLICGNGEPTVDPDLLGMLEKASELGMTSVVVSNGYACGDDKTAEKFHGMSASDFTQRLYDLGASLMIKLETLDPELYDATVGLNGAFAGFEVSLDNIYRVGFNKLDTSGKGLPVTRLAFSCVVSKSNFFEVPSLKDYSRAHSAQFIAKFPSFLGRAEENKGYYFSPTEDATVWLREHYVREYSEKPETLTCDDVHCAAWSYGTVISAYGDVRLCYSADVPDDQTIGSVRDASLEELLMNREEIFFDLLLRGESCHIKRAQYISPATPGVQV